MVTRSVAFVGRLRRASLTDSRSILLAMLVSLLLIGAGRHGEVFEVSDRVIFAGVIVLLSVPVVRRLRAGEFRRLAWGLLLVAEGLTATAGLLFGSLPRGVNPFAPPTANLEFAVMISVCGVAFVLALAYSSLSTLTLSLKIDAVAGGLALSAALSWLYLNRVLGQVSEVFTRLNHREHWVIGMALVAIIVIAATATTMVDVTRDHVVPYVGGAALVISVGMVLAQRDAVHDTAHWGVLIDLSWIAAYALGGWAASIDVDRPTTRNVSHESVSSYVQARKIAAFGLLAMIVTSLAALFRDPPVVGGLALAAILVLLVRLLMSLRIERVQSDAFKALAETDALTGLANRRALARAEDDGAADGTSGVGGVILVDLDNFKEVNDSLGHRAGDLVLVQLAHRLRGGVDTPGVLARLGGDEFAMYLPHASREELTVVAHRIEGLVREPTEVDGLSLQLSASVGVAVRVVDGESQDELIRKADIAMYRAKGDRSGVRHYDFEHDRSDPSRLVLFGRVSQAVRDQSIGVHLQPVVHVGTSSIVGCEALARWSPEGYGPIPPDRFVPMIELQGLMVPFTEHVLRRSIDQVQSLGDAHGLHRLSVNVSERDFVNGDFPQLLHRVLGESGFPPTRLTIEITESILANDNEKVGRGIESLRRSGVRISVDDFGTGFSALSKLVDFSVDELKIDKAFTRRLLTNDKALAVVKAAIELGRAMSLDVVAEGVETAEIYDALANLNVDLIQGYHIARPMPIEECRGFLASYGGNRLPPG